VTIGEFLASIFEYLRDLVPFRLVHDWEQGILVEAGRIRRRLTSRNGLEGTGWHFFVPVLSEIHVEATSQEVASTSRQDVTTKDGVAVSLVWAITFRILDLAKLWRSLHDHKEEVLTAIEGSAGELVRASDLDELGELPDMVSRDLRERFEGWGLELERLELKSFTYGQAVRLIQ
jgi:regulator of protease activity HflC (stomatin/prohibitin superfamily)